ncbi:MAG TPA: hypothetical protein VEO55_03780 [Candidatus Dormibacteraeota bacterium]|nr:hypothetical protein [Candidatus Dormibacteraeota bacterium]
MKHAGPQALDELEPILREIRKLEGLTEKKRGTFYHRGNAMLHFHEDPAGFFADLKVDGEFVRLAVNTKREEAEFLRRARTALRAVVSRHPKSDA